MAKFEILPGLTFVDRKGWGAKKTSLRLRQKLSPSKR